MQFGGVTAVDRASIEVRPGEVVGLIGPNGAGKTSLVNAITGEVPTRSGSVALAGEAITDLPVRKRVLRGLGRTFQSPQLLPTLTGQANVMLAGEVDASVGPWRQALDTPRAKALTRKAERQSRGLLEALGRADAIDTEASALPYGAQRMVEIARNLAMSPQILLLDEPGAGLTNEERDDLAQVLREVAANGVGCLLIDHNMPLIRSACDRVVVMVQGAVLAEGTPDEILSDERVVEAYLGKATS